MTEQSKAGMKEFIFVILWAIILSLASDWIKYVLPSYKIIGIAAQIIMFAVLAYAVLTRYCATFTYTFDKEFFRANRTIGHRNREFEIRRGALSAILTSRPKQMRVYNMSRFFFPNPNTRYLVFENVDEVCAIKITASREMNKKIYKLTKNRH